MVEVRGRRRAGSGWREVRATARIACCLALLLSACRPAAAETLTVEVIRELPHDPGAFTQGLELDNGVLYESTGLVGRSSLRQVDRETGEVIRSRALPGVFAEGLTVVGGELLQLTYTEGILYRWDKATFEPTGSASYEGEGWGLCYDGEGLWMSDGSSRLTRRDPQTFAVQSTLDVRRAGEPVPRLNELECVGDEVYANVWLTDEIVRVDASSGRVTATIDASALRERLPAGVAVDVLNGIAFDAENGVFLLTGKFWPASFEVRFVTVP